MTKKQLTQEVSRLRREAYRLESLLGMSLSNYNSANDRREVYRAALEAIVAVRFTGGPVRSKVYASRVKRIAKRALGLLEGGCN